jgi:hypothetical protein
MFYLSGAINVLLLLIVRPRLLLFPRPKELDGQERQEKPSHVIKNKLMMTFGSPILSELGRLSLNYVGLSHIHTSFT